MLMDRRQKLESVDLSLQGRCRLLEAGKSQAISDSQTQLVAALVGRTMGRPTASRPTASGLTIGSKASRLADKAKRRDRRLFSQDDQNSPYATFREHIFKTLH